MLLGRSPIRKLGRWGRDPAIESTALTDGVSTLVYRSAFQLRHSGFRFLGSHWSFRPHGCLLAHVRLLELRHQEHFEKRHFVDARGS